MKAKTTALSATLNETDRRMVAAAIQSHLSESRAIASSIRPLGYQAQMSSRKYKAEIRHLEKRLRFSATVMERWAAAVDPTVEVLPLRSVFDERGVVPPSAIRSKMSRFDFVLVWMKARLLIKGGMPIKSLRFGLSLDPLVKIKNRSAEVQSLFPKTEGRSFRGTHVIFGLRPNLLFWVPKMPGGAAYIRPSEIEPRQREKMLVGPMKMGFRKLTLLGTGAGTRRAEWLISAGRETLRSARFETMMVLKVPRGRTKVRMSTQLEAETLMPGLLAGTLGRRRFLRGTGHVDLPVPKSLVRTAG